MIFQKKEHYAQFDVTGDSDSEPPFGTSLIGTSGNLVLAMDSALDEITDKASVLIKNRTSLCNFVEKQNRFLAWVRPVLPIDGTIKLPIQTPYFPPLAVGGSPEEN